MMQKLFKYWRSKRNNKRRMNVRPAMIYAFEHKGKILPDTRVGSSTTIEFPDSLKLDNNVFIGQYNFLEASNGMTIEEGCQITNFVSILTHSSHNAIRYYGKNYRYEIDMKGYVKGNVHIGKYTFIGPHVTIMPGTTIGKGSIVSAYSMVKGDFPDFSIIAGNPAKVIGDTRDKDKDFLKEHPELQTHHDKWAKE